MHIDKQLLHSCKRGERLAQSRLYKSCYSILMSVCVRYKRNREDAAELVNMGFLKVLQNLDKYNEKVPFEAWIRKIMINTVIDEWRKVKKETEAMEYTNFENNYHYNHHIDINEAERRLDADELEKMIQHLPPMSQRVFNLYAIDGYSHKEIAEMLGISDGTSKWHVSFAREKLKEMIDEKLNAEKKKNEIITNYQ